MFHYCSYWSCWSRRLGRLPNGDIVDLNLTPIGGGSGDWDDVRGIRVRRHFTVDSKRDQNVDTLPDGVYAQIIGAIGWELTNRLLTEDFLSQIDWDKYKRVNNGGANLADILKEGVEV